MCGIVGAVGIRQELPQVRRAVEVLKHRGPDGSGSEWIDENVFLGHTRLKVIDLSEAGRQPMCNRDGTVWIVFNGEIYNYRELRQGLSEKGYVFNSQTDTEVILHSYEEKKEASFNDLNGMFAVAIYDKEKMRLTLARDRLGIKPLYYCRANGKFVFGSEIKAILASGVYAPSLNWQGVYDYFTFLYVPCPETIFQGIFQVPPAHALQLDLKTNEMLLWRYWEIKDFGDRPKSKKNREFFGERKVALRQLLADSVERQMISDVPLGVFLSGGVDSPIITGLMAQASSCPVKTFTVCFQGEELQYYDERKGARATAEKFGTAHREITVNIVEPMEMLNLVEYFDQPFGNPTFYLMYLISKHTRPETTVALCGAGGDELFAGYPRYRAIQLARWLRWVPHSVALAGRRLLGLVSDNYHTMRLRRARKFLEGLDRDFASQFVKWTYFLNPEQKRALLGPKTPPNGAQGDAFLPSDRIVRRFLEESPLEDFGNRVLHLDVQTFLLDNILEYTDKMSMAVGLEVRVPFLDHRLVEHSLAIPFSAKLQGRKSKVILREAFADLLPEENLKGPKKGFSFPLAKWMRDHFDRYFYRFMNREEVEREGLFNWNYIQMLREQHRSGKRDNSYELFSVMVFDVWYRKYILGEPSRELSLR